MSFGVIYRHTVLNFGAVYAKTFPSPASSKHVGWFDQWDYRKGAHPRNIEGIMSLQKRGKTGGKLSAREEYEKLLKEEQEDVTNQWYEAHLRALLNRRRKKK